MTLQSTKPAWSARCDCYHGHASASGRCTCRDDGDALRDGVTDPTHYDGQVAICSDCRANCPAHRGERNPETGV